MPTPYAEYLAGKDPIEAMRSSLDDYRQLVKRMTPERWGTSYAPGKWTGRHVMVHVAQWEMIFGVRARCAISVPGYVVQPLDQDLFMIVEGEAVDGPTAWTAFEQSRRMNIAYFSALSSVQRRQMVHHPERGEIDVNDILTTLAGHPVHHYQQLLVIAA